MSDRTATNPGTGRRSIPETAFRLLILLVGLTIAHFGVTLFLFSELGSDPFNVIVQGVFRSLEGLTGWGFLTHGRTHIAINLVIIALLLIRDRSYVKAGTFLCMIAGGPIIDMFSALIGGLLSSIDGLAARLTMLVIGCVILAFGMTLVIASDAGTGPNDLVAVVTAARLGTPFGPTRIATDCLFVLAGFLLGATVGVGTLVCMFLVGTVAGLFLPVNQGLVDRLLSKALPAR